MKTRPGWLQYMERMVSTNIIHCQPGIVLQRASQPSPPEGVPSLGIQYAFHQDCPVLSCRKWSCCLDISTTANVKKNAGIAILNTGVCIITSCLLVRQGILLLPNLSGLHLSNIVYILVLSLCLIELSVFISSKFLIKTNKMFSQN